MSHLKVVEGVEESFRVESQVEVKLAHAERSGRGVVGRVLVGHWKRVDCPAEGKGGQK